MPFFKALKIKGQFEWTPECKVAFEQLKTYLSSSLLLAKSVQGDRLFIYLAVSEKAVNSMLVKQKKGCQSPIYYTSKAMMDAETRYPVIEKLALALITIAQRLRPYFQAHSIMVLTNFPLHQIFQKPGTSGRLMKWALELSEYDIAFQPQTAIKGQAVADFIAELTPSISSKPDIVEPWTMYVDDSSNDRGCGAGVLPTVSGGMRFEYALRFNFRASNNEAKYETLLVGL